MLRENRRQGLEQELQPQNYAARWPWTHIYSCSGCVCETLHEQRICCTMLTQQVSNTSACPETVANRAGNPEITPRPAREKNKQTNKKKAAQALGLVLHASLVPYLEYRQYRTRIIAFVSPFTISVDTQTRDSRTRWEVLAIPAAGGDCTYQRQSPTFPQLQCELGQSNCDSEQNRNYRGRN